MGVSYAGTDCRWRCASSLETVPQCINDRRRHAIPETTRCPFVSLGDGRRCSKHCQLIILIRIAHNRRSDGAREDERGIRRVLGEHHAILAPGHAPRLWFPICGAATCRTVRAGRLTRQSTDGSITRAVDVLRAHVWYRSLPD
jgi:hypothetical protein